jgi:hypothetical protein
MGIPAALTANPWIGTAAATLFGVVLGFFGARFWFTKKERVDFEQKNYENSTSLVDLHKRAFDGYAAAIQFYCATSEPTFDIFTAIATQGDVYFYQAGLMCAAILSNKVDPQLRDHVLLPKIASLAHKTLPDHYETLQTIAKRKGFAYGGELRRQNYTSIFTVVEKYGLSHPDATSGD